jgi:site-specific DNA recombinase
LRGKRLERITPPMKLAAIYARFSTDLQSDRSIDDQIAVCRAYAERQGLTVAEIYQDRAISGASIVNRHGMQQLLAAASARRFQFIVADSTSRLGRDQEDRAAIRKRTKFAGITIMTPADGVVTDLTDGIRAVIDSVYIDDLRHAIRRAQRGRVSEGLAGGGLTYGYAAIAGEPGRRRIVDGEAAIVRRIFKDYLAGETPRAIAHALNAERATPPRGGKRWNASTILGSAIRCNGILRNPIYGGELVWNRVRMVKHPDTSRRISQPNAETEWQRRAVPELAIVTPEIFAAAAARLKARGGGHPSYHRRPRHILSGLLRCAACGAGMASLGLDRNGKKRIRCSAHAESGTCPDPHTFYLETIETAALEALRAELKHPQAIAEFVRTYHEERKRLAAAAIGRRSRNEKRLAELEREIARLVDAIGKGFGDPAVLGPASTRLELERQAVARELAEDPGPKVTALHPAALARYESMLGRLQAAIAAGVTAGDQEANEAMRDLIESVTVGRPAGQTSGAEITISGRLNALFGDKAFPNARVWGKAVAGESYRLSPHTGPASVFSLRALVSNNQGGNDRKCATR